MKLFPACGVLDDDVAAHLHYPLYEFFARGVFKVFHFGLGLYLRSMSEFFDHISLIIDAVEGVHLRRPLSVFDFGNDFMWLVDVESSVRLN